ncbi:hypothetical protein BKA65DRAFT_554499 [Rhexocercosporidium sp. MPI-PUGE-AT-0058]|nr:hypothetical protein BKA65DRAFT_554499 [Rhexocercosporidium sp. MPI-PUGE-AT-0058]
MWRWEEIHQEIQLQPLARLHVQVITPLSNVKSLLQLHQSNNYVYYGLLCPNNTDVHYNHRMPFGAPVHTMVYGRGLAVYNQRPRAGTLITMGTYAEIELTWPTEEPSLPSPSTTAASTPTATPLGDAGGVPAYDVVVRYILDGTGGNGVNQLLGYKADLTRREYDCGDKPEWSVLGANEEAADSLPPTITAMTIFGDSSCGYDEAKDYEATADDGMAFVAYINCDEWARMLRSATRTRPSFAVVDCLSVRGRG